MLDLNNQLEAAAKSVIEAADLGLNLYSGQDNDTRKLPAVIIHAGDGYEHPWASGNWSLTLSITVRSNASDTTIATHRERCNLVFAVLMADDIASQLSAVEADFHAFGVSNRQSREDREEDSWISTLSMDVYCCQVDMV